MSDRASGPAGGRPTPQAVERLLGQLDRRARGAGDETLASAVVTGRKALSEWQVLAGQLRDLEGQCQTAAVSASQALGRLEDVLDLLDRLSGRSRLDRAAPGAGQPGALAVRLLGAFELTIDGQRVLDWRGQRTQSLAQFLFAHRSVVPRDELIAAVWPDLDEDDGRHRLHQAVYELRRVLRASYPGRSPVLCADGGYQVDREVPVWVDAEEFSALASAMSRGLGARRPGEAIELGQRALQLYRGDFLSQASGADWATAERNRLRACFVQVSVDLGEALARRGDDAAALAVVDPVLATEPWNEDATVIKMRCHARAGARSLAAAAYRSCVQALSGELGLPPAASTSRVHEQIRAGARGEPAPARGGLTAGQGRTGPRPAR